MTDPTIDNPTETELKEGINQYILWQLVALKRRHFKASSSTSLVDKLIEAKAEMMSAVIMSRVAQAKEAWTREARIDELTKVASHNNSEYTSDYIENRLSKLQTPNQERIN